MDRDDCQPVRLLQRAGSSPGIDGVNDRVEAF